ncbi:hypothetical protein Tco_0867946 [Tanacetum coccineum]
MKRQKTRKDAKSTKGSKSKESKSTSSSKGTTRSQPKSSGKSTQAEEQIHIVDDTEVQQIQGQDMGNADDQPNVKAAPKHDCYPIDFSAYVMNHLKIDNLTQDHLVGSAFDLLKGTCKSHVELEYNIKECHQVVPVDYFINNDLEYLRGGSSSKKYTTSTIKTKAAKYDIQGIEDMVPSLWSPVKNYSSNQSESYEVVCLQYAASLGSKKLSNLERDVIFDLGVALWMFTRRIVNLKWVEDLQLLVKSYQKKLNITKPETFRLMRTDELYKFIDGTLTSVRSVLHDIASNLRIDYLPKRLWSSLDRKRSRIMIKAIDQLVPYRETCKKYLNMGQSVKYDVSCA